MFSAGKIGPIQKKTIAQKDDTSLAVKIKKIKQHIIDFFDAPPLIEEAEFANILSKNALDWLRTKGSDEEKKRYFLELLFLRCRILTLLGQYAEVIELLENEKEKNFSHWEFLAIAYLKSRKYEKVEACCKAIFHEKADYLPTYILKANALLLQKVSYSEFESDRMLLVGYIAFLAALSPNILKKHAENQYWFEMIGLFVWGKKAEEVVLPLKAILQNLITSHQDDANFNIAILHAFIAHINFMSGNYVGVEKSSKECRDYLSSMMKSVKGEYNKLQISLCDHMQLDAFLTQYTSLLRANAYFFQKDYAKANQFASQSQIKSEYFQDWVHCLQQLNPFFIMDIKPCIDYFSFCDLSGYVGIDTEAAKQKKNAMVASLERLMKNKYRSKESNQALLKILSEMKLSSGGTLLHVAARLSSLSLLRLFFGEGSLVDINMKDDQGRTVLDHVILVKEIQSGKSAEIFDKSILLLRAKQAKTAQELQSPAIEMKREPIAPITQSELPIPSVTESETLSQENSSEKPLSDEKKADVESMTIRQSGASSALTTTATLLSDFAASDTASSVSDEAKQDERHRHMEMQLGYFQRKSNNLSRVVKGAISENDNLSRQLHEAAETEYTLQAQLQQLKQTVSSLHLENTSLRNAHQNLLQNPPVLLASPIVVIQPIVYTGTIINRGPGQR